MADIFHEVDEDIRRERLKKLWDRFGPYVIGLALLIVVGIGGWRGYEYWQTRRAAEDSARFEAALVLADAGKHAEAEAAFAKVAETAGTATYRTMARLRQAAALTQSDPKSAIAIFDSVAADTSVGGSFQDLAALRAGFILVDTASFDDMKQRLEPLTGPQRAFRHSARELLALSAWRAGNMADAKRWSDLIINDAESPAGMRQRMEALLALTSEAKG
ncbi:MAG: tetratricopeptide repeat protein [Pseudorhodoplanes sp.]|nr:tetratricopeptide repeat protein [Pseudorhodoplanes sp.]